MRMHPNLANVVDEKDLFKLAKKVGLNKIDYDIVYALKKLSSKNEKSANNIQEGYQSFGYPLLIGDGQEHVAIFVSGINDWFKTSAIIKCRKVKKGFKLETLNSFYLLERKE